MELRKIGITVVGWALVLLGVAALILPGPGLLLLLSGLVVLSREYAWAGRLVEPVKKKAFAVAAHGVSSYPRIALSALAGLGLVAAGALWVVNPVVATVGPFGPRLPLGGWPTGATLAFSGIVATALLVYSIGRFRPAAVPEPQPASEA